MCSKCVVYFADRLTSQKTPLTEAGDRAMEQGILKELSQSNRSRSHIEDKDKDNDSFGPSSHQSKTCYSRDVFSVSGMFCSYCLGFYNHWMFATFFFLLPFSG